MLPVILAALLSGGAVPAAGPPDEPPLPYVRGGSWWVYASPGGSARVRLEELEGVHDGARRYRWEIRLAGAAMQEELVLRTDGLFTASRTFTFVGRTLWALRFDPPELTVALPLEVGRRWEYRTPVLSRSSRGWDQVEGAVEALEPVQVPAGTFDAYRIRLARRDSWGSVMDSVIWLDPRVGVVMADGVLRWPGLTGAVQRMLGLDRLQLRLVEAHVEPARPERPASAEAGPPREGKG